ncbi:hypothetical protein HMPREF1548_03326 [Clostridium sp. KLE 1755]|nr:hypothetical protein HMPREF1548_03326 [Clostridium sp. KLE 1755]
MDYNGNPRVYKHFIIYTLPSRTFFCYSETAEEAGPAEEQEQNK